MQNSSKAHNSGADKRSVAAGNDYLILVWTYLLSCCKCSKKKKHQYQQILIKAGASRVYRWKNKKNVCLCQSSQRQVECIRRDEEISTARIVSSRNLISRVNLETAGLASFQICRHLPPTAQWRGILAGTMWPWEKTCRRLGQMWSVEQIIIFFCEISVAGVVAVADVAVTQIKCTGSATTKSRKWLNVIKPEFH